MLIFKLTDTKDRLCTFTAFDDDKVCGACSFVNDGYTMHFESIKCGDDTVLEGLVRSSMNFCANRGCYLSVIKEDMLAPAFRRLGFSEKELTVEIPEALTSSACGCKH